MKIVKKIWPEFFDKVASGEKNFDVRLTDFECKPGDTLVLEEWDPETKQYTGRKLEKKVTYVARLKSMPEFWPKEDLDKYGLQVIAFCDVK